MRPLRGLSWAGTAYIATITALGVAIVPVGLVLHPLRSADIPALVYLAVFTQVAALMPLRWRQGLQTLDTLPLVAVALVAPGGGAALIVWLFTHDGRWPSKDLPAWRLISTRARSAVSYGIISLLAAAVPLSPAFAVPARSIVMVAGNIVLGYSITALGFKFMTGEGFWKILTANVGPTTIRSMGVQGIGGGALYMMLQLPAGYVMGVGLLALLITVRANMSDAQHQEVERIQTLELMAQALDARDPMTELHSQRVSELAAKLSEVLQMTDVEVERIRVAGLLHDIGKIGVSDSVLKKAGPLDAVEWEEMRAHADRGADMIARHTALVPMAPWVRHHHERWDGSGYPKALQAEEIPLGARVLAVADSFDTITGARVYRRTVMTPTQAVQDISRASGRLYDPMVVDALRIVHGFRPLRSADTDPNLSSETVLAGLALVRSRRRFAWLASGMGVSSLGDPLTSVALAVSIYGLSHSAVAVALTYGTRATAAFIVGSLFGGMVDGREKRAVVIACDLVRAALLLSVPLLLHLNLWAVIPMVALLGAAEAVGQSTRESVVPELVKAPEVPAANAAIGSATMVASSVGYPVAGLLIWAGQSTTPLFVLDALTFVAAAVLTIGVGHLSPAAATRHRLGGALRSAWELVAVRRPLIIAAVGAFFISMTIPATVVLAYQLSASGPQAYSVLQLLLTIGMIAGNLIIATRHVRSGQVLMVSGLTLMAIFSVGVALSPILILTAGLLFIASVGNAIYAIGNRSVLQSVSSRDRRTSVMMSRFMLGTLATVGGSAVGGLLASAVGPRAVYALLGVGLAFMVAPLALNLWPSAPTIVVPRQLASPSQHRRPVGDAERG